jgi:hypothetical protein
MTRTSNFKNTLLVLIDLQSNPPKRPQSTANYVKGIEYCQLLTSHILVESHPFCTMLDLELIFYHPLCYNTDIYCSVYVLQVPY